MKVWNSDDISKILERHLGAFPTGSYVTCNPPVTDTDQDWVVLIANCEFNESINHLQALGFDTGRAEYYLGSYIQAARKGTLNLILTWDEGTFQKTRLATDVAKELNLLEKSHRVLLFQAIRGEISEIAL